jgi:hypothetical protein
VLQRFWRRKPTDATSINHERRLAPLGRLTEINAATTPTITTTRCDLIGISMDQFRETLATGPDAYIEHTRRFTGGGQLAPPYTIDDWWTVMPFYHGDTEDPTPGRWRCDPYPTKPLNSDKAGNAAPVMLNNCTQFAVEFAGDFLTQAPIGGTDYGNITAIAPDGEIDYYLEGTGAAANRVQRIRWYGFPRDVNGDGVVRGTLVAIPGSQPQPGPFTASATAHNALVDVVPLRNVIQSVGAALPYTAANARLWGVDFERSMIDDADPQTERDNTANGGPPIAVRNNYAAAPGAAPGAGTEADEYYTCAWGPNDTNRPKLIRLIVVLDDPGGRMGDGQRFEYVFNLP